MTQIHGLRIALVLLSGSATVLCCSGTTPTTSPSSAVELCAAAMAMSPEVQAQATKLQRQPIELAREACAAVVLAAQVVKANIPELGSGGATATTASMAGAAGAQ